AAQPGPEPASPRPRLRLRQAVPLRRAVLHPGRLLRHPHPAQRQRHDPEGRARDQGRLRVQPRERLADLPRLRQRTVHLRLDGRLLQLHEEPEVRWELYALAVAFGVADAFAVPAQTAYMPSLLKREQLVAARSVSQSTAQMTTIVGPVPAGFMIKTLGVAWAFFADAISFLFIIGALWKLPDPT